MAKESLSEKILKIMNAPDGYGILFCNILDIKEKIQKAQKRLKARNEEIKNPKICPICKKKLSIIDDRGGYCNKHYWIVPSDQEWVEDFVEEMNKIFKEEFGDKLI